MRDVWLSFISQSVHAIAYSKVDWMWPDQTCSRSGKSVCKVGVTQRLSCLTFAILWSECRRHTALIHENWNPKGAYEEPFLKAPECSWILVPIYVLSIHIGSKNNTTTQEAGSSGLLSITCSEASEVQASYTVDLLKVTSCLGCNSLNTFGLYFKFLCHGSSSFDIFNISCPQS